MKNFNVSEKYRKYLIELQFKGLNVYTVWGTDMKDDEVDKVLAKDGKIIVFKSIDAIAKGLQKIKHPFFDKENFTNWVIEKGFRELYNVNDLRLLSDFKLDMLFDRSMSLEILNCINLIEDFFIQIEDEVVDSLFENPAILDLKDFIYNNYFWKKQEDLKGVEEENETVIISLVKKLYDVFLSRLKLYN